MNRLSPVQVQKLQALDAYLRTWRQIQLGTTEYRQALAMRDLQRIAGLFRANPAFHSLSLCDFLGRPETQVVEMAATSALPPVYAVEAAVLKDALMIVCRERGAERARALVGLGVLGVVAVAFLGWASGE